FSVIYLFPHTSPHDIYTLSLHDALPIFPRTDQGALSRLRALQDHHPGGHSACHLGHGFSARRPDAFDRKAAGGLAHPGQEQCPVDRKSTRLNSSHVAISYAVFCLKKKKK